MAEATWYVGQLASVAGANKQHLTLYNGVGSGKIVKIYKVVATGAPTVAVTGLVLVLHAVRITAAPTGGTVKVPLSSAVESALPAQIVARAAPTSVTGEEATPFGIGTVSGEETSSSGRCTIYEYGIDGMKPVELAEGVGMTIKQGALASAGACHLMVWFTVVP